jgi:hypothetical protein
MYERITNITRGSGMIDITAAAIATLISAGTSATISLFIARSNKQKSLDDQLDSIIKIGVQYPYLENRTFTEKWKSTHDDSDEMMLRYDMYCNLLFNYLSRLADHYNYNEEKIEKYLAVKMWVRMHRKNWKDPKEAYENVDAYDKKFVDLMDKYTKGVA